MPEGAAEERCKAKESTNRLLREQDGDWERRKLRELGTEAKLGPKTSLRLKHSLIEEGWWKPQTPKGAEQDSQTREPAVSGEQTGPQEESYTRSSTPYPSKGAGLDTTKYCRISESCSLPGRTH